MSNDHVKPSTCQKCGSNDKRVYRKPCDDGTMDHPTRNADPWHDGQLGICNFNDIHLHHPHLRESWCLFWRLVEHATAPVCVACGGQVRRFNNVWKHVRPAEYSPCGRYPYAENAPAPQPAKPMYAVGVSVLVTNAEGHILLGKRKQVSAEGLLSTPGGRLEYDETIEECAAREFAEECGTESDPVRLGPVTLLGWRKHNRYGNHYFMFYVHATSWNGSIGNGIPDKSEDWEWFDRKDLTTENCTEPADILDALSAPAALKKAGRQ